jgi:putative restriction endonuclease
MADGLHAHLDLSVDEARAQWQRVLQREWRDRQERFLPIEVLLCYGLFWRLNPHQFGGGNIDRVPPEVKALAATLRRSAGSLTSKMLNLDGSRQNSAREEPELFLRLGREPDRFAAPYALILVTARQVGLGEDAVPDFLSGLSPSPSVELIGQEELGPSEVDAVLAEQADEIRGLKSSFHFDEVETVRLLEQKVRLGQHRFAGAVLAAFDHRCGFCGFAPRQLTGHRLLVASHIKPWAQATDRERLDPRNGVCACPIHDSAFDTGLLTVRSDLTDLRIGC